MDDALAREAGDAEVRACVHDCWREAAVVEADWAGALAEPATLAGHSDYHRSWDDLSALAQV